ICTGRFNYYISKIEHHPKKYSRTLDLLNDMKGFPLGIDLDNYPINRSVKKKINNIGECYKCKDKENCDYMLMINRVSGRCDLDFQVVNHNLYLTSLKIRDLNDMSIYLSSSFTIIDEAHKFKEAAQEVFGFSFSIADIIHYLEISKGKCMFKRNTAKYNGLLSQLKTISQEFMESVKKKSNINGSAENYSGMVKFDSGLSLYCKRILNKLKDIEDMKLPYKNGQAGQYINLRSTLNSFLDYENDLTWVTISDDEEIVFHCTPLNISELLYKYVWDRCRSHAMTSGTMSDGNDFEYFKFENGLNYVPTHLISESATESPFDYKNNSRLYIPSVLPKLKENPNYIKEISDICLELIHTTNGHTIILFTSYETLNSVYAELKEQLKDYEVIKMARGNKTAISSFKRADNAILFAAGSMWEGIDIAGDKLSSVIIVRLPFPQRSILMEEKKKDCFSTYEFVERYCVPNMLIKLRQGVGRLIRSETDTGVVTILDERVARGGRYRHRVLQTLNKFGKVENITAIRSFLEKVKTTEYWGK
ncbi:MAG: ATP-dependent DNA helicase, partial [Ruminococcus sp.]|nr:ATP-dependent DNA helicase [Ruminococcus sp.]